MDRPPAFSVSPETGGFVYSSRGAAKSLSETSAQTVQAQTEVSGEAPTAPDDALGGSGSLWDVSHGELYLEQHLTERKTLA